MQPTQKKGEVPEKLPTIDEAGKVSFGCIAREWRCKFAEDAGKLSLTKAQELFERYESQVKAVPQVKRVQRIVCGGCLDFKVIISAPAAAFPDWGAKKFEPEEAFLKDLAEIDGITSIETQSYTLTEILPIQTGGVVPEKLPTVDEAGTVSFSCIAREWRCKFSDEAGKLALTKAQELLEKYESQIKAVPHVKNVQRIVCGGCLDFKVIISAPAAAFPDWGAKKFEPEEAFLKELAEIGGITSIDTQTYTLTEM